LPAAAEHLAGEAFVAILGLFSIANHPFCRRCLSKLQPLGRRGLLGTCGVSDGAGWVETEAGERYSRAAVAGRRYPVDRPTSFLMVCSPFRMSDASLEIIHLIKFSRRRSLALLAAGAMIHALRSQIDIAPGAVLVPVPMHTPTIGHGTPKPCGQRSRCVSVGGRSAGREVGRSGGRFGDEWGHGRQLCQRAPRRRRGPSDGRLPGQGAVAADLDTGCSARYYCRN
jgi:hypothetical protein